MEVNAYSLEDRVHFWICMTNFKPDEEDGSTAPFTSTFLAYANQETINGN